MEKIKGNTLVANGTPIPVSSYRRDPSAVVHYEVIRLIDGTFLFARDHIDRLLSSCRKAGRPCSDQETLMQNLEILVQHEPIGNGNVKLLIYEQEGKLVSACFFIPHFYPSEEAYRNGVKTAVYAYERPEPTVKRWNESFREDVSRFIHKNAIYEAILMNRRGLLTEGSRSNLYFLDAKDRLYTAPSQMILPGITRKYVLDICRVQGVQVIEQALSTEEAIRMKSCFISGTSPKILPVKSLDEMKFTVENSITRSLMESFNAMIQNRNRA